MSNIAGKAYAMNVLTPVKPAWTWLQYFIFMVTRCLPGQLGGLLGLSLIHFARWVVIRRDQWPIIDPKQQGSQQDLQNDYVLFLSNFNGTWDQYIDAFADGIPSGLDTLWYCSTKYPHSIPIAGFKNYISHNQIETNYYYNATPGSAQRDIKQALKLRAAILQMQAAHEAANGDSAVFAAAFRRALISVQNSLGSPGIAPTASPATAHADENLRIYLDNNPTRDDPKPAAPGAPS